MSLWLEEKYLRLVSPQLDRYVQKHPHVFNFRCPLCGDSERVKTKARGFCFPKGQILIFKCHNCSVSLPFAALLRRLSPRLYDEYLLESLKERGSKPPESWSSENVPAETLRLPDVAIGRTPSMLLRRLDRVPPTDAVRAYVEGRKVPVSALPRLWGTTHCQSWLTPLVGEDKSAKVVDDKEYLVFPFTMPNGDWYGCQVRALDEKIYVTFRWTQDPKYTMKVFGLEVWAPTETTYLVEGPMDSLFVPNALAVCGSDLYGGALTLEQAEIFTPAVRRVFVFDNEPRNKEVVRLMRNVIRMNEPIFVWPKGYPKDINDVWKAGQSDGFLDLLRSRTYSGLRAELEFAVWQGLK